MICAYRVLVGKYEGKRPLRRPRLRLGDNIRMDLREIGWEDVDWIHLAQDRALVKVKIKVKVKFSLVLTKYHAMNTYCESGGMAPRILNLGVKW
jgi:hypothetical protein